jgi:hypothetical protein
MFRDSARIACGRLMHPKRRQKYSSRLRMHYKTPRLRSSKPLPHFHSRRLHAITPPFHEEMPKAKTLPCVQLRIETSVILTKVDDLTQTQKTLCNGLLHHFRGAS